ncbi:histone acetyltransferase 1 [Pseudogymnoascus verrucosus]|uniref:Histone acetyltransferase type B catalytic subunit n=1 Tax=Pseudogymnoascus verrucosus TaxID=342668 RepID=A0A1B8GJS7_9PEZI|nr:histone acetyltransferase 1 [Pseudogymnoascus verrucosus]OBT96054.1 histone acetyltransferase 1 [Pseudogymnoascus verrucosus]
MASSPDDWSTQSNDALHISLVRPENGASKTINTFHPKFTYPIFGEEESIFGYQNLKIHLRYNASDMRPGVLITYSKRFKAVGDVEPTDLKELLSDFLPENAFQKSPAFDAAINDPNLKDFTPPGKLLKSHEEGDAAYEIWYGNSADPAIQQLLRRLQILVALFIEGGTAIDDAEWGSGRWTVFLLYKKGPATGDASPYTFMGYCTVYNYYPIIPKLPLAAPGTQRKAISLPANSDTAIPFPDQSLSDLPIRSRLSQFIILPPFQGGGHGARLYSTVFAHYQSDPQTVEITIEDPNEAFDDLRDLNDLIYLRSLPEFQALKINTAAEVRSKGRVPSDEILEQAPLNELRKKVKIAPRQFQRLVEMQLLSSIPPSIRKSGQLEHLPPNTLATKMKQREYRLWGLLVKQRLYKHNKDSLIQLEHGERIDKLGEVAGSVEEDYARLLGKLDGGEDEVKDELLGVPEAIESRATTPGKRAAEGDELDLSVRQSKKVKVEDAEEE